MPVKCFKCDATTRDTAKYCPGCGAPLVSDQDSPRCSRCGANLSPGDYFCGACGTQMADALLHEERESGKNALDFRSECRDTGVQQTPSLPATLSQGSVASSHDSLGRPNKKGIVASPIYKVGATYEGGHPNFLKKARGTLTVWPDRLVFDAGKSSFALPIADLLGCELKPMQFGLLRSALGGENRAIQVQTPMAHVECRVDGIVYELRFHIHALTIPGESENARNFRDRLYTRRPAFGKPTTSQQPPNETSVGVIEDIPTKLRQLAELRHDGIVTEEEYERKKADLLNKL